MWLRQRRTEAGAAVDAQLLVDRPRLASDRCGGKVPPNAANMNPWQAIEIKYLLGTAQAPVVKDRPRSKPGSTGDANGARAGSSFARLWAVPARPSARLHDALGQRR